MKADTLTLTKRELTGKKLKQLRSQGLIPSVIYGGQEEPILTASPYGKTAQILKKFGYHSTLNLELDGKKQMALIKNIAIDPVKRSILNVEFQAVSVNEVVQATAPIVITGFEESQANKNKLALLTVMEEIDVKAKAGELPASIELDASKLVEEDEKLTLADLKLPKGVKIADKDLDLDSAIATLFSPAAEAAARAAEENEVANDTETVEEDSEKSA